jgi:hypothetical protein
MTTGILFGTPNYALERLSLSALRILGGDQFGNLGRDVRHRRFHCAQPGAGASRRLTCSSSSYVVP